MRIRSQRGNILFLILLAIILFVALSLAVMSQREGGKSTSKENAQAGASAMLQYMTLVRTTVQRLMLVNGCAYDSIDFRTSYYTRANGDVVSTAGSPLNPKAGCAVFQQYGGPLAPQSFEKYEQSGYTAFVTTGNPTSWSAGHFVFRWVSRIGEGTDAADFAMMADGMSFEVCMNMLDMHNPRPVSAIPSEDWESGSQQNVAPPPITGTDRIGDDPINLYSDVFARKVNSTVPHCRIGMILISR